jgi:hypothetical protein
MTNLSLPPEWIHPRPEHSITPLVTNLQNHHTPSPYTDFAMQPDDFTILLWTETCHTSTRVVLQLMKIRHSFESVILAGALERRVKGICSLPLLPEALGKKQTLPLRLLP